MVPGVLFSNAREAKSMNDMKHYTTAGLIGVGVGAGLMYLFDPNRGRTRRARLEDRAASLYHAVERTAQHLATDVANHAEGLAAEARRVIDHAPVDAPKLVARVRAKLGRLIRNPHRVTVEANEGRIVLTGGIDACEAGRLLAGVIAVPGVTDVENKLTLGHLAADSVARGAAAIASVAGGLITFAGLRVLKRAG